MEKSELLKNKDLKWILIVNLLSIWIQTNHSTFASIKWGYYVTPAAHGHQENEMGRNT